MRSRRIALVLSLVAVATATAACGGGGPGGGSAGVASDPGGSAAASLAGVGSPTPSATPTPTLEPLASLAVEPALLDVLSPTVGAVPMTPDPENAAQLTGNRTLGAAASGLALARYARGDDIVVVSVTRLRPGIYSDGFYQTWRSDYDSSACEPAGGWAGTDQLKTIGSQSAFVATCTGGATTYQLRLAGDILVAAIAVGPGTLGRDVIAGLRP